MSQQTEGAIKTFTATEALEAYRRVKFTSGSGTAVEYADADDVGIGITQEAVAVGENAPVRLFSAEGSFKVTAAGAFSIGDDLYGADDGKFDDDPDGGRAILVAVEAASGDGSVVEALHRFEGDGGLLYANIADSAEVENTIVETAFDKSKTIDGALLKVGDVLEIIARIFVVDNNSTDTLTAKLYIGTEEIVTTGAVDVADNDIGFIHAFVTVRAAGAGGSLAGGGLVALGVPGTVTAKPFRKNAASEDLSGDVAIAVKGTWSVAHADNEAELEQLVIIHHRQ